jgi:integrase
MRNLYLNGLLHLFSSPDLGGQYDPEYPTLTHLTIRTLRGFFKYLYDQHILDIDFSYAIPKDNYKKQAKLPSVYSQKEIETMIGSINRTNATGKRNYVIVLLAARLGLRASDIANLKFENLHWEECTIVLNQYKTGKKIELPILEEIGDAIIDYLRYGRPNSKETFVFLLSRSPYTPVQSGAITGIVHSCLVQAGINIENRKHGSHALRHSLAGILLEKGTILPVISEVLGHENTASTRYYLRIDLKSLRRCALEVPSVSNSFYDQKGGYFYE